MEKAKQAKNIIGIVATVGATLALGALSFAGMLVITSSLGWAALAFLLAVTIEGAVYRQNIFEAMKKLGNQKEVIEQAIADRELEKLKEHNKENEFIRDYFNEKKYLHDLEENLEKYSYKDKETAITEIIRVRARLNRMKALLITSIRTVDDANAEINTATTGIRLAIRALVKPQVINPANPLPATPENKKKAGLNQPEIIKKDALDLEVKRKNRNMKISIFVAAGSGIAAGLVTLSTIQTCFLALGLGLGTATLIGAPIIGFAALGYALLMYRTISDMIQNDTLKKWAHQIHDFSHTKADAISKTEKAIFYLKIAGIVSLVALAVCATIATAGTWWYLARDGAEALKFLPKLGGAIISIAAWSLMIVPNLLFNLVNGLKSAKLLPSIVLNFCENSATDLKKAWKDENPIQFINPFRILSKITKALLFIGHVVSTGITSDQIPWLHPLLTTAVNSGQEAINDAHYIAKHPDHAPHEEAAPLLAINHQRSDMEQQEEKKHKKPVNQTSDIHHSHDHAHDHEDHQHTHGDFVLKEISTLFNYLSASWNWISSSQSWQDSKVKFFEKEVLPKAPALSENLTRYDTSTELNELANKYSGNGHAAKAAAFTQLQNNVTGIMLPAPQNQVMAAENEPGAPTFLTQLHDTITQANVTLKQHRHFQFFKSKLPESEICLNEILCDRSYQQANRSSNSC